MIYGEDMGQISSSWCFPSSSSQIILSASCVSEQSELVQLCLGIRLWAAMASQFKTLREAEECEKRRVLTVQRGAFVKNNVVKQQTDTISRNITKYHEIYSYNICSSNYHMANLITYILIICHVVKEILCDYVVPKISPPNAPDFTKFFVPLGPW